MVGFFHENWSGTDLHEPAYDPPVSFNVARKPVLCAEQEPIVYGRPKSKTLGSKTLELSQPAPSGTPVKRVPVSHSRDSSEDTLVAKEELRLPGVEPAGDLDFDAHKFHCFTPIPEDQSYFR